LELFGQIERFACHGEALFCGRGEQQNVFGISVGKERGRKNIALRSAGWQTCGRSYALDVPDHARNFDVVGEAGKLSHQ
jgi:hypothetical protein